MSKIAHRKLENHRLPLHRIHPSWHHSCLYILRNEKEREKAGKQSTGVADRIDTREKHEKTLWKGEKSKEGGKKRKRHSKRCTELGQKVLSPIETAISISGSLLSAFSLNLSALSLSGIVRLKSSRDKGAPSRTPRGQHFQCRGQL